MKEADEILEDAGLVVERAVDAVTGQASSGVFITDVDADVSVFIRMRHIPALCRELGRMMH